MGTASGKGMAPFLGELVPILRAFGELNIDDETAAALCRMSAATIDRRLAPDRAKHSPIPIAKYAITRAGNDRWRWSVRPTSAMTSSTSAGGNTRVSTPTDTKSDNRRSETGFTHPARGMSRNDTAARDRKSVV